MLRSQVANPSNQLNTYGMTAMSVTLNDHVTDATITNGAVVAIGSIVVRLDSLAFTMCFNQVNAP